MLSQLLAKVWKKLSPGSRQRLTRATQAKFTASAAAVITDGKGRVLLLEHLLRPYSGWGLPGGFISAGESPEECIRREIREEIGIELAELRMLSVRVIGRHIEILFAARATAEPSIQSSEIVNLGWFLPGETPLGLSAAQDGIIRRVLAGEI